MTIKNIILKSILRFNEIRKPEAIAKLIKYKDKEFLVKFFGHMCFTCGTYDYFEDLMYELKEIGINTKIKEFYNFGDHFIVLYEIKSQKGKL
jgi:hypothetical protein